VLCEGQNAAQKSGSCAAANGVNKALQLMVKEGLPALFSLAFHLRLTIELKVNLSIPRRGWRQAIFQFALPLRTIPWTSRRS
jgi:hypothetical protein